MLNLSDNELDRLSREAASQHDPGDPLGPQSWDRLELRLDKELGRAGPDVSRGIRGIRRLPFQYAPVLLLVVGVTWYFVKVKGRKTESSGSPPLTAVKTPQQPGTSSDSSLKNPAYSDKSTSTLYPGGDAPSGTSTGTPTAPASSSTGLEHPSAGPNSTSPAGDRTASGTDHTGLTDHPGASGSNPASSAPANGSHADHTSSASGNKSSGPDNISSGLADRTASHLTHHIGRDRMSSGSDKSSYDKSSSDKASLASGKSSSGHISPGKDRVSSGNAHTSSGQDHISSGRSQDQDRTASAEPSGPERTFIKYPSFTLRSHPRISDSALRAYVAPAKEPAPALVIKRSFTFGFQIAPDFTSVNALAGDRPGSNLGFTVDYNFLNRLHIGTGILFSRRNYTARGLDYHVPPDYYRNNNLKPVDFVKGSMNMLEIPIDLRYDFSVTGNTLFFASAGVSSYLFGRENCNYYYDMFGREVCKTFRYSNTPNGLFSSVNLSLGVETGISNSISVLVAPYMKLPTNDIGFGKVKMNSVGINFAIHYSPITSQKRKH
ncbi:MAG TPA: outer membrane beta-barrel protein [Puia sp.]|nr:outer membrane beta-barrel protein [Puia sp.]